MLSSISKQIHKTLDTMLIQCCRRYERQFDGVVIVLNLTHKSAIRSYPQMQYYQQLDSNNPIACIAIAEETDSHLLLWATGAFEYSFPSIRINQMIHTIRSVLPVQKEVKAGNLRNTIVMFFLQCSCHEKKTFYSPTRKYPNPHASSRSPFFK